VGAFAAGLLAAFGMGWVKNRSRLREDAVIGLVFTTWFAAGLLLLSLFPSPINLRTIVFGNILGISDADIVQVLIIAGLAIGVLVLKWRDLLLYCFDASHARSLGLNTTFLHFLLLGLLSATAVAALQTVGAVLVVAMLVTPGATAYLLTDRFGKMIGLATSMGVFCGIVGAYLSYFLDGSTGGCIVVLQTALFLVALVAAPKHGLLASRAKRRDARSVAGALMPSTKPVPRPPSSPFAN
jgi:ABC-type Mn2+/Zn2+ transport system permease subunit